VTRLESPYYGWSPIVARPRLAWPGGAAVAVCTIVGLQHVEWFPPDGVLVPPSARYGGPYPRVFDPIAASHHEYGNRVGVFRIMRLTDRYEVPVTAAVDSALTELAPALLDEVVGHEWEVIAHGVALSRMVTEDVPGDEEREYVRRALDELERATGARPRGWMGADYGESSRTVEILAGLGVDYVCDWPHDEQPVLMRAPSGDVVSLPLTIELDEVLTHRVRGVTPARWSEMAIEALDQLRRDGAANGRLYVLHVHPHVIGQPGRIKYLDAVLRHIRAADDVWLATGLEIVDWYRVHGSPVPCAQGASPNTDPEI
jgi:allantoinase